MAMIMADGNNLVLLKVEVNPYSLHDHPFSICLRFKLLHLLRCKIFKLPFSHIIQYEKRVAAQFEIITPNVPQITF